MRQITFYVLVLVRAGQVERWELFPGQEQHPVWADPFPKGSWGRSLNARLG